MGQLKGKTIVVTGASRGLGETMSVGFSQEDAQMVLAARTETDLDRVAEMCRLAGAATVEVIPTDITNDDEVRRLVEETIRIFGRIDTFVANAGTSYASLTDKSYGDLIGYDLEIVEQLFKVNVLGTWLCLKYALGAMKKGSSFIAIGAESGRVLYPGAGIHAVTKSCVDALTLLASKEIAAKGIRANVLSPGGTVDTNLFSRSDTRGVPRKDRHLPREIMVPAAVWLASDDSVGVTGTQISAREFNERPIDEMRAALTSLTI